MARRRCIVNQIPHLYRFHAQGTPRTNDAKWIADPSKIEEPGEKTSSDGKAPKAASAPFCKKLLFSFFLLLYFCFYLEGSFEFYLARALFY